MKLEFVCKTNKDFVMVNTAKFELADGVIITVDRKETESSTYEGNLNMLWKDCYLLTFNDFNIVDDKELMLDSDNDDVMKMFQTAKLLELGLEDDADEDYEVEILYWACY